MSEIMFANLEGAFFWQRTGVTEMDWKTCTGVGDIAVPVSGQTIDYCLDPAQSGRLIPAGFIPDDPSQGSYSLEKPLTTVYNALLENLNLTMNGRVNWVGAGARDNVRNYEVAWLMVEMRPSAANLVNNVRSITGSSARVTTDLTLQYIVGHVLYPVTFTRQTVANTANANCVYFLAQKPESRLTVFRDILQYGVIGLDHGAGYLYDTEVKLTTDGDTWAQSAVDPFTWGDHITDCLMIETLTGYRIIVVRTDVLGAPPEASYSDDGGASWTNIAISATNSVGVNALVMVGSKILAAGDDGYIYKSIDQAESWSIVESATETTENYNDITQYSRKYVYAVADDNDIVRSTDGGENYDAITGPAGGVNLLSVHCNRRGYVFVGTNDGRIFRSVDRGDNWTEILDLGGGTIPWIEFDPKTWWTGYMIHNTVSPVGSVYRTEDGGVTWYPVSDFPTNVGLNQGHVADPNNCVIVGEAQGGTTFIAKSSPF